MVIVLTSRLFSVIILLVSKISLMSQTWTASSDLVHCRKYFFVLHPDVKPDFTGRALSPGL
jgi:hypothetical protein